MTHLLESPDIQNISLYSMKIYPPQVRAEYEALMLENLDLLRAQYPKVKTHYHFLTQNLPKISSLSTGSPPLPRDSREVSNNAPRYAKATVSHSHQPLNFPSDIPPLSTREIFVNHAERCIPPREYLQNFYTLAEDLSVVPLTFQGLPIEVPGSETATKASDEYQGRLDCYLQVEKPFVLPSLVNAEMLAIRLPSHCRLAQDPETGQYGILSSKNQVCTLEWKIRADRPKKASNLEYLPLFEGLSLEYREGTLQVIPPFEWPAEFSDLEKAESLASWISHFSAEDGKRPGETLSPLTHLNRLLTEKKGRCLERALLFNVLAKCLIPKLFVCYTGNFTHAMPLIVDPHSDTVICFDLGGVAAPFDLLPRTQATPAPVETPPKQEALLFQTVSALPVLSSEEERLLEQFKAFLIPEKKTFSLTPKSWALNDSEKPKNLCLVMDTVEAREAAIQTLSTQEGVFVAPSLEALRTHAYVQEGERYIYQLSSFANFLSSEGEPKTLVIPGNLLKKAQGGPAKYYPLLDITRMINKMSLDKAIQIVVLISEEEMKSFREDFRSRFQSTGQVADEYLDPGVIESKADGEVPLPQQEAIPLASKTDVPPSGFRVNAYNFEQLFPYPEITPSGLRQMPGYLNPSETEARPNLYIIGELTPKQWRRLSEAQDRFNKLYVCSGAWESHLVPASDQTVPSSSGEESKSCVSIQDLPRAAIPSHLPAGAIALALPEVGHPLLNITQTAEGEFKAQFTALKTLLETSDQTLVLYGKLSPSLEVELLNMSSGTLVLAGEKMVLGKGSHIQILNIDKFAKGEARLGGRNPFCQVLEAPIELSRLDPFETRLEQWKTGQTPTLFLSSFDLVNPATRSLCRDLVNSAFAGHVMIEGELIDLGASGKTIEVRGPGIPKKIREMAQVFSAYQSIESPPVAPLSVKTLEISAGTEDDEYPLSRANIIPTPSRLQLLQALKTWLASEDAQHPLFLVEGPSGIGKTAVLKAYLQATYPDQLEILLPSEDLIQRIEMANREGKIVLIDEINTLRPDQLEAITVLMQSQPKLRLVGTQNPISFEGRVKLTDELMNHSMPYFLGEYPEEELCAMCESKGISAPLAKSMVSSFLTLLRQHRSTFRDFIAGISTIEKSMGALTCSGILRPIRG